MILKVFSAFALATCVSLSTSAWPLTEAWTSASPDKAQDNKAQDDKLSDGERKAAEKFNQAVGTAKLDAAAELLKKYPKTVLRSRIADNLAGEIGAIQDPAQRIAAAEKFAGLFKDPSDVDRVNFVLLDAYVTSGRAEDAFRLGDAWLVKNPDDVDMMRRLSIVATNESIKGNNKFVEQGRKYSEKAVELVENDKKPVAIEVAQWAEYKTKWRPSLYREAGILALRGGDNTAAKTRLERAAELKTRDPAVYAILGQLSDEEYAVMAQRYKAMPEGAAKAAMLKQAQEQMDKTIQFYAQTVAVAGGKPEFQQLLTQVMPGLEEYYKFRNGGSTEGLQKLIEKYKASHGSP